MQAVAFVLIVYNGCLRGSVRIVVLCRLFICATVCGVLSWGEREALYCIGCVLMFVYACGCAGMWTNWYMFEQGGRRSASKFVVWFHTLVCWLLCQVGAELGVRVLCLGLDLLVCGTHCRCLMFIVLRAHILRLVRAVGCAGGVVVVGLVVKPGRVVTYMHNERGK